MWFVLGLLSAFFLGCYDISKKVSLRDNAVVPVLFSSVACSALLLLPFLLLGLTMFFNMLGLVLKNKGKIDFILTNKPLDYYKEVNGN